MLIRTVDALAYRVASLGDLMTQHMLLGIPSMPLFLLFSFPRFQAAEDAPSMPLTSGFPETAIRATALPLSLHQTREHHMCCWGGAQRGILYACASSVASRQCHYSVLSISPSTPLSRVKVERSGYPGKVLEKRIHSCAGASALLRLFSLLIFCLLLLCAL
jgi:hypothetical protein